MLSQTVNMFVLIEVESLGYSISFYSYIVEIRKYGRRFFANQFFTRFGFEHYFSFAGIQSDVNFRGCQGYIVTAFSDRKNSFGWFFYYGKTFLCIYALPLIL